MPVCSRYQASDFWSHSAALSASHGASSGSFFARRSTRSWAQAIVPTAIGLIFGMRPV